MEASIASVKFVFHLAIFSREQAKSECDWVAMSSVFVASQSSCFFPLFARTNLPRGKQGLDNRLGLEDVYSLYSR